MTFSRSSSSFLLLRHLDHSTRLPFIVLLWLWNINGGQMRSGACCTDWCFLPRCFLSLFFFHSYFPRALFIIACGLVFFFLFIFVFPDNFHHSLHPSYCWVYASHWEIFVPKIAIRRLSTFVKGCKNDYSCVGSIFQCFCKTKTNETSGSDKQIVEMILHNFIKMENVGFQNWFDMFIQHWILELWEITQELNNYLWNRDTINKVPMTSRLQPLSLITCISIFLHPASQTWGRSTKNAVWKVSPTSLLALLINSAAICFCLVSIEIKIDGLGSLTLITAAVYNLTFGLIAKWKFTD